MKRILILLSSLVILHSSFAAEPRPNILLIVADDQGWGDIGYHAADIRTPTLDRLAREVVELDWHYVQPQCTPTRVALMTGRYPSCLGSHCTQASEDHAYPFETLMMAKMLGGLGYDTALIGKWHMGSRPEWLPNHRGFAYSYGIFGGAVGALDHHYRKSANTWHRNGEFVEEEGHVTDLITREAVQWLKRERGGKPFFLYLPLNTPLRGGKGEMFEGGMRVPAFVSWPAKLQPRKIAAPMHAVDWMPTIAAVVGFKPDGDALWDGQNVWPLLTGDAAASEPREFYWVWGPGRWWEGLRRGDWKIIRDNRSVKTDAPWMLFNLADDPLEKTDQAATKPELVAELAARFAAHKSKDRLDRAPWLPPVSKE